MIDFVKKENYDVAHIPSVVDPDTLFTFTSDLKWLLEYLKYKKISARYNIEDISYLSIRNLKKITIPMKCFCDIRFSKLSYHMGWYGNYGISFAKKWGQEKGLQPIQYINQQSSLCADMKEVFNYALKDSEESLYKDFLANQIAYYKPYQGYMKKVNGNRKSKKCLADEHEWRFIPQVDKIGMPLMIPSELNNVEEYNKSIYLKNEASLLFEYNDIKHIIIPNISDFKMFLNELNNWNFNENDKNVLLSKVIVFDEIIGDI